MWPAASPGASARPHSDDCQFSSLGPGRNRRARFLRLPIADEAIRRNASNRDDMAPDDRPQHHQPTTVSRKEVVQGERFELLDHLQAIFEPVMAGLGLVFLGLLLLDYASVELVVAGRDRLGDALQAIWAVFVLDFGIRFVIAPAKTPFLRQNWLSVLSLVLPFLRPLRIFRVARAVRSLSLLRLLGGINRGMRVLRKVTRGRQFAYIGVLTGLVVFAGAVGVRYFDRDIPDAPIQTFGDALWWSAAMVTTINNEKYAVSAEARVIAILQRIYALSVFGFITASIASYLVGSDESARADKDPSLRDEVVALRREVSALRRALELRRDPIVGGTALRPVNEAPPPPADGG